MSLYGNWGAENWHKADTLATATVTRTKTSFVSDPGIVYLLPTSMELFIGETPLTMLDILYPQRMANNVV